MAHTREATPRPARSPCRRGLVDDADLSQELPNERRQNVNSPRASNQWHTKRADPGGAIKL